MENTFVPNLAYAAGTDASSLDLTSQIKPCFSPQTSNNNMHSATHFTPDAVCSPIYFLVDTNN